MDRVNVGVIGCGAISGIYLKTMSAMDILQVVSCADIIPQRAEAAAAKCGCRAVSVEDLLTDPEIEIVVNLTVPAAHASVAAAALEAGKCVYNEKPLAATRDEGRRLLELATARGLRIGCAPDTFLGGGQQTCRKLIDDGAIGQAVAAAALFTCRGHERWHPNPEFYYAPGGGPVFDMGPYYLTALVNLVGAISRVTASGRATFAERVITSQPKAGTRIKVQVPTHVAGVLDFAGGAVGSLVMSYDVWKTNLPRIEIYGTEGTLSVPDPNGFGGRVRVCRADGDWLDVPLTHGYIENIRGIGVADMAYAMRGGWDHRAGGELAYHVLDVMEGVAEAAEAGRHVAIASTVRRPAAMPAEADAAGGDAWRHPHQNS